MPPGFLFQFHRLLLLLTFIMFLFCSQCTCYGRGQFIQVIYIYQTMQNQNSKVEFNIPNQRCHKFKFVLTLWQPFQNKQSYVNFFQRSTETKSQPVPTHVQIINLRCRFCYVQICNILPLNGNVTTNYHQYILYISRGVSKSLQFVQLAPELTYSVSQINQNDHQVCKEVKNNYSLNSFASYTHYILTNL
eukprot:TRINITY_DN13972_c1_g1_i1.p1 TRINITY_DN13972_c1_g1~~TRINITY_DN13972_c1_g1_i1.p1  ORF type:complete len:190 (-),score=-17.76 TRINITY_DN13972_c1_g1_i1:64-633(-)